MKIRIIKDLPRCEIGQEFEVFKKASQEDYFVATNGKFRDDMTYYLDEIEDYYEECIEMPKEGEEFWFVTSAGKIEWAYFRDGSDFTSILEHQGHHKTKEEAQAYLDYCKAYKKKEIEDIEETCLESKSGGGHSFGTTGKGLISVCAGCGKKKKGIK